MRRREGNGTGDSGTSARSSLPRGGANSCHSIIGRVKPFSSVRFEHALACIYETRTQGGFAMMAKPIGSFGDKEFPKNSINIDKFTGFFDKLPEIFGEIIGKYINELRISGAVFEGVSGERNFGSYVKFKRGISPPDASRSRSAGCRSCPRPPAGGWSRGNSARRATP